MSNFDWYNDTPSEITKIEHVTEDVISKLQGCGEASYGLGNNWTINWERFYEILEMEGYDMQDLGGPADNKIRRLVQKMVKEGDIS